MAHFFVILMKCIKWLVIKDLPAKQSIRTIVAAGPKLLPIIVATIFFRSLCSTPLAELKETNNAKRSGVKKGRRFPGEHEKAKRKCVMKREPTSTILLSRAYVGRRRCLQRLEYFWWEGDRYWEPSSFIWIKQSNQHPFTMTPTTTAMAMSYQLLANEMHQISCPPLCRFIVLGIPNVHPSESYSMEISHWYATYMHTLSTIEVVHTWKV